MTEKQNNTVFTTCPGIFSYARVSEPRFEDNRVDEDGNPVPIYSTMFLFDKKEKAFKKAFDAAVKAAFDKGVKAGKFNAKAFATVKKPLRDGDAELESGQQENEIYKGRYFFNAVTTKEPPKVMKAVGGQIVPIDSSDEFYSGCIGRLLGSCYAFKVPTSRGIAVGLNGCLKLKDGERLDGRPNVQSAFDQFAAEGELDESEYEGDSGDFV